MSTMNVILVRHGEAEPTAPDRDRVLSARGSDQIRALALSAELRRVAPGCIFHSGLTRARHSAEILAHSLRPAEGVQELAGLAPEDDPRIVARLLEEARTPLVFVGHLPHLGRLASLLLLGEAGRDLIALRTGTALGLTRDDSIWRVAWMVRPSG